DQDEVARDQMLRANPGELRRAANQNPVWDHVFERVDSLLRAPLLVGSYQRVELENEEYEEGIAVLPERDRHQRRGEEQVDEGAPKLGEVDGEETSTLRPG